VALAVVCLNSANAFSLRSNSELGASSSRNGALSDFFCWAVQGPGDDTIEMAWKQLESCGGRIIFSNFSNPGKGVIKLYDHDMSVGRTPAGWADNTDLFRTAWEYIAKSSWPDKYKWFAKVDADTFIRTRYLPRSVSLLDSQEPVILTVDGRVRGALEVMSSASFRHPKSDMLWTRNRALEENIELGGEDLWITWVYRRAGFKLAEMHDPYGCVSFLLSYFNLPSRFRDDEHLAGGTRNVHPEVLVTSRRESRVDFDSDEGCIDPDVVAIHPVKDISIYQEHMRIDEEQRDLEWKYVA